MGVRRQASEGTDMIGQEMFVAQHVASQGTDMIAMDPADSRSGNEPGMAQKDRAQALHEHRGLAEAHHTQMPSVHMHGA